MCAKAVRLNCALLGLTHPHAGALLATLNHLPEVGRVNLWEDKTRAAQGTGIPASRKVDFVSDNLAAVLKRDCDFAIVCVRPDQTLTVARRALAAGCHLLTEKPVGLTAADTRTLKQAADRAGKLASVLYVRRAHPVVQGMRQQVLSGVLGPLLSLEARFLATQVRFRDPSSWLFQRRHAGGGILSWLGCHYIDLLQYISGDPITDVTVFTARRSGEEIDVEDSAALALRFVSGAIGTLHLGYTLAFKGGGYLNQSGHDGYLACNGRNGRIVWPDMTQPTLHLEAPGRRPIREKTFRLRTSSSYSGASGERFVSQFMAALRGRAELPATLADAEQTARVIEAAYLSARTRRTEPIRRPRT